jgi:hypothetical protein
MNPADYGVEQGFQERMDTAENLVELVRFKGGDILLLDDGRLELKAIETPLPEADPDLFARVKTNAKAIAEYLSIEPAPISDKAGEEYRWLSEFAHEFARTAWRRVGQLSEREAMDFYGLVSTEFNDCQTKIEPGMGALMAIADALIEQTIEIDQKCQAYALRDGVPVEQWESVLRKAARQRAEKGEWKEAPGVRAGGDDGLPF